MMHLYRKLALLSLAGILLGTAPASYAAASEITAATKEVTGIDNPAITENESNNQLNEEVLTEDTSTTENKKESKKETKKENKKETKKEPQKEIPKADYKLQTLTITKDGFVADSFNGVDALYRKGYNDGSSTTYSCAAYIKRYYSEVYGVSVSNLLSGRTPAASKGTFKLVKTPEAGDIVACASTGSSNHWAIVKQVNDDNTVTLIEQNWKWTQGGQTVCKINRSISISSGKFYRLYE